MALSPEITEKLQHGQLGFGTTRSTTKLPAQSTHLTQFFEGGLPMGSICEFGAPLGREGRVVLCNFLAYATSIEKRLCLWVHCSPHYSVYPPAWFARGIRADKMIFAHSENPLQELKRALMSPLFHIIIIDSALHLTKQDCSFLNRQAQKHNKVIIIVRDFLLSNTYGNIWARLRVNVQKCRHHPGFDLRIIKGTSPKHTILPEAEL